MLWTRFAPAAEPGAREQVGWELATDEGFRNVVRHGTEVVDAIGALGTGDGPPSKNVVIDSIAITEVPAG